MWLSLHVHVCGSRGHFCTDLLVGFCCDVQNTPFCTQVIAAAGSSWTAPGQAFPIRKKKGPPFSHPLYAELLCYLSRSWLHPKKLNSRSAEIWSSSPTSYPELLFIKVRYSFTFTGHSFCSLSALLNTKQVTYGLCQLHCKSFVPFNENIASVFLLSLLEPSRISVINGAYWWRNASARLTALQGHRPDLKLLPGLVSTSTVVQQRLQPLHTGGTIKNPSATSFSTGHQEGWIYVLAHFVVIATKLWDCLSPTSKHELDKFFLSKILSVFKCQRACFSLITGCTSKTHWKKEGLWKSSEWHCVHVLCNQRPRGESKGRKRDLRTREAAFVSSFTWTICCSEETNLSSSAAPFELLPG